MSSVRLIGFDMDHTLAMYRAELFETLAFESALAKLVESKGYSRGVLKFGYDHDFAIRGLVVDKRSGNILKMDRHNYVSRAFHGRLALPDTTRKELYSGRKIPLSSPDYASVDTFFSLPEVVLYAQLVEYFEAESDVGGSIDYGQVYADVRACLDEAHADGTIKSAILRDPEAYVIPDPTLALTLDKFRRHGKRLFLLTNSELAYTDAIMGVLLNGKLPRYGSWRDYFDIVITGAMKPAFFVTDSPTRHAEGPRSGEPVRSGDRGSVFVGGNASRFEALAGYHGDQILYFGDHTYGDILRSKRTSGWRTAMIIQELEEEVASQERARRFEQKALNAERVLDTLIAQRDSVEIDVVALVKRIHGHDAAGNRARRLREDLKHLRKGLRELDRRISRAERRVETSQQAADAVYNRNWGRLFKDGSTTTRFGAQVTRFACIYTSRASNLFRYPVNKYYKPPREFMPHELVT